MTDTAKKVQLPICANAPHLVDERGPILRRHDRISIPAHHQDLCFDPGVHTAGRPMKTRMEANYCEQRRTAARQLQNRRSALAETNGGEACIHCWQIHESVLSRPRPAQKQTGCAHELTAAFPSFVEFQPGCAVKIERERCIAKLCHQPGPAIHVIIHPHRFMRDEYPGGIPGPVRLRQPSRKFHAVD
jgi:hypothetical protein